MSSNARASGMPSSSAGKEVGDIVQTPDAPIKSWRYLGGGKWEPNDVVRFTETSPGGVVRLSVGGETYDPLAISPYYHFHGFAGGQFAGDPKFFDLAGANHGIFGAHLSVSAAWANAGYVSTVDPATGALDSAIRMPALNFDYAAGEKLVVWWHGACTPEAAQVALIGDGVQNTIPGWRVRVDTTGKFNVGAHSPTRNDYTINSDGTVFDGTPHSFAFVLDGQNRRVGMWSDEVYQSSFAGQYTTFTNSTEVDTRTAATVNIGTANPAPGTTGGIAVRTRALVILRLPPSVALPSVQTMTDLFTQLRANPGRLIRAGAI
jgi:hypothetical protein